MFFMVGPSSPCLPKSYVGDAKFLAKGNVDGAEGIEGAAVDADAFAEAVEDEGFFVEGGFEFTTHYEDVGGWVGLVWFGEGDISSCK